MMTLLLKITIVPNALDLFRKVQLLKRITALYKSNFYNKSYQQNLTWRREIDGNTKSEP